MTPAEVQSHAPMVQFGRADRFGVIKTTINPHFDPRADKAAYPDVRTISFDFLDDRLVTLWIGYEETFKWPALDEFVTNLSKSLNVTAAWSPKRNGRQLSCDGFSLLASMIASGPSIRITDDTAQDIIGARREEAATADETQIIGEN